MDTRNPTSKLKSILEMELGGVFGNLQIRTGHRLDELAERIAAIEATGIPPA